MTNLDRRETHMRAIHNRVSQSTSMPGQAQPFVEEPLPHTDPRQHHHISEGSNHPIDIGTFLQEHEGDPAVRVRISYC
jgi:hypothetical protein